MWLMKTHILELRVLAQTLVVTIAQADELCVRPAARDTFYDEKSVSTRGTMMRDCIAMRRDAVELRW